jgi:hypothetical protein
MRKERATGVPESNVGKTLFFILFDIVPKVRIWVRNYGSRNLESPYLG